MDDEFRKTVIMMGAFVWLLQHLHHSFSTCNAQSQRGQRFNLGDIASLQFGFSGLS
jgi:hypothetical protein